MPPSLACYSVYFSSGNFDGDREFEVVVRTLITEVGRVPLRGVAGR